MTTTRNTWREGLCALAVISGVLLVAVVETLSLVGRLTPEPIRLIWIAWLICAALFVVYRVESPRAVWRQLVKMSSTEHAVLGGLLAIVVLTCVTAWYAPPNTFDSMAYHMSRVVNWAQHGSVAHYATPTPHQLFQPPWTEFAILQLQLISGSDRFANFVQWLSMLGCLITSSLIARQLGASTRTQTFSAVFVASLPMGVLQASSTQNNYVLGFWLSAFALNVLMIWNRAGTPDWRHYAMSGGSLGLAMCTKGTAYFFAAPFVLLLVVAHLRNWRLTWLSLLFLSGMCAVVVNFGQFARNQQLYGFPLGPVGEEAGPGYQVSSLQWNGMVSNIVRNVAMHLGTPSDAVNDAIFDDVSYLHEMLGIWLGSPLTSWPGKTFERSSVVLSFHESTAGNLMAVLLLAVSPVLGVTAGMFSQDRRLFGYTLAWASGYILFSALLRWHPWETRLDLGWFVLGAPMVALVLSRRPRPRTWIGVALVLILCCMPLAAQRTQSLSARQVLLGAGVTLLTPLAIWIALQGPLVQRRLRNLAAMAIGLMRRTTHAGWAISNFLLLAAALPWVLLNETRPLVGPHSVLSIPRDKQYFVVLPQLETPYVWAAAQVTAASCQRVGLLINLDDWDYPLWRLLSNGQTPSPVNVVYLGVAGPPARLADASSWRCAVIATRELERHELLLNGLRFRQVENPSIANVAVFVPEQST